MNAVCGDDGEGVAVLLRAAVPDQGPADDARAAARGPLGPGPVPRPGPAVPGLRGRRRVRRRGPRHRRPRHRAPRRRHAAPGGPGGVAADRADARAPTCPGAGTWPATPTGRGERERDAASLVHPYGSTALRPRATGSTLARAAVVAALPGEPEHEANRARILAFVDAHPDALHRSCLEGHLTGSAAVVDPSSRPAAPPLPREGPALAPTGRPRRRRRQPRRGGLPGGGGGDRHRRARRGRAGRRPRRAPVPQRGRHRARPPAPRRPPPGAGPARGGADRQPRVRGPRVGGALGPRRRTTSTSGPSGWPTPRWRRSTGSRLRL